ncbi:MAG: TIGR03790 family protein, partial [Acidobacteria bacterium]|nr:TIGR03790 family protein [Acidobacteriota bacterium]
DGYTSEDIRALIDRSLARAPGGRILLDARSASLDRGNDWLVKAAENLAAQGFADRVVLDRSERVLQGEADVLGYYSWGSNDPAIRIRDFGFRFVPGALAAMFVSSDGRTFQEPPGGWQVGSWDDKSPKIAGSPQSLAGDLIRAGITGIAGHVAEPFLEATVRPHILFPAYLAGFSLAESFYLAMPLLGWQTVVVGDPLCAPFRERKIGSDLLNPPVDQQTALPAFFSARRVRAVSVPLYRRARVHPDTIKSLLRAEVFVVRGDQKGARLALEEATAKDSRAVAAQVFLASLYEQSGEYGKAIDRYRTALEMTPDDPMALNNLAYALAVHRQAPQEALPLAEKAYSLAKENPNVADTLGWILHLTGQNDRARELLKTAAQRVPGNAVILLHTAVVLAEVGDPGAARDFLKRALEADPSLEKDETARRLIAKLNPEP